MNFRKKIKYIIDNLTAKDDEEKTLVGRRTFLTTLPALVVVPKMIEEAIKQPVIPTIEKFALTMIPDVKASIYTSGQVIHYPLEPCVADDFENWQQFMLKVICKAFEVTPEQVGLTLKNNPEIERLGKSFENALYDVSRRDPTVTPANIRKTLYKRTSQRI